MEEQENGITLIAKERHEQINKHQRSIEGDFVCNSGHEKPLTKAASALSSEHNNLATEFMKPEGWTDDIWSKMMDKPYKERLVLAGAFIAAELDRVIFEEQFINRMKNLDFNKISNLDFDGIDPNDAPKYCDAYITSGDYEDRELTDYEIEWLNGNASEFIHESLIEFMN